MNYFERQMEGNCWLCGKFRRLTAEHIPPESAFNEYPILLQEVSDRAVQSGVIAWQDGPQSNRGFARFSLCARCNNIAGQRFVQPYVELVKRVAERLPAVDVFHSMSLQRIRKPQLVLRQIIMQFVTANGENFAKANDWVRPFLRPEGRSTLPRDVYVYIFASNTRMVRTTGISGHVHLGSRPFHVVSEFTFWPLGTVMSYGELPYAGLTAVHDWARIPYKANETRDIDLRVNPVLSALPIDFRSEREIEDHQVAKPSSTFSESSVLDMQKAVARASGEDSKEKMILAAHPAQVELMKRSQRGV